LIEPDPVWTEADRELMARALELAAKGSGLVSPGPLVGCVVVDGLGRIVGEGFYRFEEIKHAETIALGISGEKARGGTAYVSLEPHAHHGRTPPCTNALLEAGIKRVVAPIEDLNPQVSGRGFEHLRNAGVEVHVGLLAEEATRVNEAYLHYMRTGRPFVHLKLAVSLDGKIATRTGDSQWITGNESRARVHELRHHYDAILVGVGTAKLDDPALTDRSGMNRRRPLVRIVLDERLEIPIDSQLVRSANETPVLVIASPAADLDKSRVLIDKGVEVVSNETRNLPILLEQLGQRSLQSVLVEGGAAVAGAFVDARLVNKVSFFIAPKIVGGEDSRSAIGGVGVESMNEALQLDDLEVTRRGDDVEVSGYPRANRE